MAGFFGQLLYFIFLSVLPLTTDLSFYLFTKSQDLNSNNVTVVEEKSLNMSLTSAEAEKTGPEMSPDLVFFRDVGTEAQRGRSESQC